MAALLKIVFVLHHQPLIEILMLLNRYLVVVRLPEFVMMMVVVVDDHEYIPEYVSDKLTMIHDNKVPNQQQTYRYNVEFL
jgi:hypothetical protein